MINFKLIKYLIFCLSLCFLFTVKITAANYLNVLPLHTGKSYILDFPIKVNRVVGGDPSAIELNLFKKDNINPKINGYQLLIVPIAEKTTNIIVWTDIGMYVFDVIIDNSNSITAETIITVPKEKKFHIPTTESSLQNLQQSQPNLNETNKVKISTKTGEVEDNKNSIEIPNNAVEDSTPENKETKENKTETNKIVNDNNNSKDTTTNLIKSNNMTTATSNKEENGNNIVKESSEKIILDTPPSPDKKELVKKPEPNKPSKNKQTGLSVVKTPDKPKKSWFGFYKKSKTEKEIDLKPQIAIDNKSIEHYDSTKSNDDTIEISLKPQKTTAFEPKKSLNSKVDKLLPSSIASVFNGLSLQVNSVNLVDNSIVIHLSLKNTSTEIKYLLWDLTKIMDEKGTKFYVRNLTLPPGILNPDKVINGDIITYPKNTNQLLSASDKIYITLVGSQGNDLIKVEVPLK